MRNFNSHPATLRRALAAGLLTVVFAKADIPAGYKGHPFGGTPWPIPGRLDFENYDLGGLNVAWKSDDKAGQGVAPGSTAANRADDGEPEHPAFWITNNVAGEVDKLPDGSLYPSAESPKSIYIGAAHATDYGNTTVNVTKAGTYYISAHFASEPNQIKFHISFNGVNKTPGLTLPGTSSYHAWKFFRNFAKVELTEGVQVMQFMLDANHLNWDYVSFSLDSNAVVGLASAPAAGFKGNYPSEAWLEAASGGNRVLRFTMAVSGKTSAVILDARGRLLSRVLDRNLAAGEHTLAVPAPVSSQVRFLSLTRNGSAYAIPLPVNTGSAGR